MSLHETFQLPPANFGPVPFYWWAGEPLDRERMAWQLDQLAAKGVRQTVVSYPHRPDGTTDAGDPELFSPAWWEFFRWFLQACRERGMRAGFQDYTIVGPVLEAIGRGTPDMQGGQMSCVANRVAGESSLRLEAEPNTHAVGAWAYPVCDGVPDAMAAIDLGNCIRNGVLEWTAVAGNWLVALVFARIHSFDPLHPESGRLAIGQLYAPFERECADDLGKTLDLFFQDELDLGSRMPFWSNRLFAAFAERHGYDLQPLLPALWHDLGTVTEKVRLDFSDMVAARVESCFFEPVFRWHESRGILLGHDNCGRGRIAEGRSHYGDYFRAMRWYSAPGCDDPKIHGARSFKGLKVNSSIAHLYQRPRVWVEAFHSSGWGITPAEVVAAIHEDFACGATLVNLHGLYYSTRGGWWEWAPPDFHFRQPYWLHSGPLNQYLTRLCWLLSQGVHRCDVAIVYPVAAIDAEPADPGLPGLVAHVGNEAIATDGCIHPGPEETAFGLGKHIFDHACDFDFVDFESLATAGTVDGELRVGPARYRVLVFPSMAAVRYSTIGNAREFVHAGGLVIAFGCLPVASERAGRMDSVLDALVEEVFGPGDGSADHVKEHPGGGKAILVRNDYAKVLAAIRTTIECDVVSSAALQVLHRQITDREVYFLHNPSTESVTAEIRFRCKGAFEQWDAWTGNALPVTDHDPLTVTLTPREARILVINHDASTIPEPVAKVPEVRRVEALDGPWEARIHPTLDNRFGDFSLLDEPQLLGPQARRFRFSDEVREDTTWCCADFDDSAWPETTNSFGPRLEVTGPLPPGTDFATIESKLCERQDGLEWRPYGFSRRWGIERDPLLVNWLSGPHGLKGAVPDEFLDFHSDTPGSVWYLRATVVAPTDGWHTLVTGARCIYQVWVNGQTVVNQEEELPPGFHAPWNIPHYDCTPLESRVALKKGANELLVKLAQPAGQRTRAFWAFDPPSASPGEVALRWFTGTSPIMPCLVAPPERRAIRFRMTGPPGMRDIHFVSRGFARVWVDGIEFATTCIDVLPDGCHRYRTCLKHALLRPAVVAIRVEAPPDSHAGDALPEPVTFVCCQGIIHAGDWCAQGLATYSGLVDYRRVLTLSEADSASLLRLDLGGVAATAEIRVNGRTAATLVAPPWSCDITPFVRPGENDLSIAVANTLANHYSVGIPSPYAFPGQTVSGLLGPVRLIVSQ